MDIEMRKFIHSAKIEMYHFFNLLEFRGLSELFFAKQI
jgi:hypothetical protein